ncbi:hypothetical protein WR25_09410 [Diploscapter pachys]|uniref:Response regulatory domain-containing protein n=1 Tax=Diploscapter pachys TaxID=2018661 RepID=A0A2A2KKX2_9BILA|nr:hypothetical protein WR25_09410 [Diploscapter pachys]
MVLDTPFIRTCTTVSRLLIVDDDVEILALLKQFFVQQGYERRVGEQASRGEAARPVIGFAGWHLDVTCRELRSPEQQAPGSDSHRAQWRLPVHRQGQPLVIRRLLGRDTLRKRIALTIFVALLASLALNALFVQLAGSWARPPIDRTGLLEQIAVITRVIERAPPALRSKLALAASTPTLQVTWSTQRSDFGLPGPGVQFTSGQVPAMGQLLGPARVIEVYNPDDWPKGSPEAHYVALVALADDSWLLFVPPERSWGLSVTARLAVVIGLGLVATLA